MIAALLVSVNYNDYLEISLSHNNKHFQKFVVVTTTSDTKCQQICSSYSNVVCVVVSDDVLKTNNRVFNKGALLNKGFEYLDSIGWSQWVVITDADIIFPDNITELILKQIPLRNILYSMYRKHLHTFESYKKYFDEHDSTCLQDGGTLETCGWPIAIGYCQIFRYTINKYRYDEYNDADNSDLRFIKYFSTQDRWYPDSPAVKLLSNQDTDFVIHIGETKINWKGRKSVNFEDS